MLVKYSFAVPPDSLISLTTLFPNSSLKSTIAIFAPHLANSLAQSEPIPPAPPVIMIT